MKSLMFNTVIRSLSLSIILVNFLGCEELKKESMDDSKKDFKQEQVKNSIEESKKESIEEVKKEKKKQSSQFCINESTSIKFGGKAATESFTALNMTLLNAANLDTVGYIRTTADFYSTIFYKECENTRLNFYTALRFRFIWGNKASINVSDGLVTIANADLGVKNTTVNRHVVWMRETWLQVMLGDLNKPNQNYLQFGLIPFQVGRGISLGAAYEAIGFFGFTPGYSIDQFAPAVLAHFTPIADRYSMDFYLATTENNQLSLRSNIESIRLAEVDRACDQRGVGRQSYIAAIKNNITVINKPKQKATIEPYIVHQHAPDQDLEFKNDIDTFITTVGAELDVTNDRLNWGIEGACNFGEANIKAWDRNEIRLIRDKDGFIVEEYSKVFTQNPATTPKPKRALVTNENIALLAGSPHNRSENGKMIAPNLYNAFNRFRPEQKRFLTGYFAVADVAYDWIPKVLSWAFGVGYASGYIDQQRDANKLPSECLMNENYTGFLPLQSVYAGKRIRHLILFNQGVPRFNVKNPNIMVTDENITNVLTPGTVNELTNIIFAGTRAKWNVERYKKYDVVIAPNVIAYWAPETADIPVRNIQSLPLELTSSAERLIRASSNYLGTEVTSDFSVTFYDKLKLSGYLGVFFAGSHYSDMAGTLIGGLPTGSDMSYIGNIALNYVF